MTGRPASQRLSATPEKGRAARADLPHTAATRIAAAAGVDPFTPALRLRVVGHSDEDTLHARGEREHEPERKRLPSRGGISFAPICMRLHWLKSKTGQTKM